MAFLLSRAGCILSRRVSGRAPLVAIWKRNQFAATQTPAPEVYTRPPPPPRDKKPGQLEQWQVDQFFEQGFVLVPSFTEEELQPAIAAINECVDILANNLFHGVKIKDKCEGAGFYNQLTLLEQQFKGTVVLLHKMGYLPTGFRQLWGNERLLNVVEQFIGPDIAGHPVWNLRTKPPKNEQVTVPWHQDNAYFDPSALYTFIPTAWIPLLDTNMENGCMQVVARGPNLGVTAKHHCYAGDTWYVDLEVEELEWTLGVDIKRDIVTCEVPFGGDKCEGAGFYSRLTLLERQFKGTAVLLHKMLHKMGYLPPGFCQLWTNERLLNVVEQFIGPDIAGHPVWNLRTKTPKNEQVTVPWHQDNAYLDPSALYTLQPTAWIPLLDTNMENGCMQVVARGHKPGVTAKHTCCAGDTWYVDLEEEEIERTLGVDIKRDSVTCEVPFGGVLFINNCIPHRSLENKSDKVRWSLDLRWQNPGKSNGFHGLKDCVVMRKADDPNYQINWEGFATVDRQKLQLQDAGTPDDPDSFDTTIHGPWMNRWEITHPNRHTEAFKAAGSSWYSPRPSKP